MKARTPVLVVLALSVAGLSLAASLAPLPFATGFIAPLFAEQTTATPPAPEKAVPAFAPGQTLTFSGSSASTTTGTTTPAKTEPNAPSSPSTETSKSEPGSSVKTIHIETTPDPDPKDSAAAESSDTKAADVPQIIGAKNLFGAAKTPSPLAARAIGSYARGCLSGAVPLPIDGPAWQEMRLSRNRNWGHPVLISLVEQFAKDAQKLDGWPGLLVGDIAQPRGGPMVSGHASHQVGLDADIWLTPMPDHRLSNKEREEMEATSMLDKTGVAVDPKIFTDKQVALIKRAASYPEVERIFVHPAIKKALCQVAKTDNKWLGKVRPYYGHYYHFHVRIKCPPGFNGCVPQGPTTGDNGCGKEVDQWLARVVPAKTPAAPPPTPPPGAKSAIGKVPIMLSELPKECQTLLTTGPEPITIPKEALMTPAAARQLLVKTAAARAALQKAAAAGGAASTKITGATAASASPALRPHMRKTVDADKK